MQGVEAQGGQVCQAMTACQASIPLIVDLDLAAAASQRFASIGLHHLMAWMLILTVVVVSQADAWAPCARNTIHVSDACHGRGHFMIPSDSGNDACSEACTQATLSVPVEGDGGLLGQPRQYFHLEAVFLKHL